MNTARCLVTTIVGGFFSTAASVVMKLAAEAFALASDSTIVDAVLGVIRRSVEAVAHSLGGAALIWTGVFTNGINESTMCYLLNHLYDVCWFFYDLIKPANVVTPFQPAPTRTVIEQEGLPSFADNPYNELDLRVADNRKAVIYQIQRVALSLTAVLRLARNDVLPSGLGDIRMNVNLREDPYIDDFDSCTYLSRLPGGAPQPDEEWLFVNGIATERIWLERACDKIRDAFGRDVLGIYNRSDGILWDLVECLGERTVARPNPLIERTRSSKAAQEHLERGIRRALWPVDRSPAGKVVMIAHSQGCLALRLALQNLVRENPSGSRRRRDMKERLRVFTFGNPSVDWRVMDEKAMSLSEYTRTTEHFAHEVDFVGMLGVVTHRDDVDSGYDRSAVFYSKGGRGHLIGAHYPLAASAYGDGETSALFKAINGAAIA